MKMSGWENQFQKRIDKMREKEVNQIQKAYRLYAINEALFFSSKFSLEVSHFSSLQPF